MVAAHQALVHTPPLAELFLSERGDKLAEEASRGFRRSSVAKGGLLGSGGPGANVSQAGGVFNPVEMTMNLVRRCGQRRAESAQTSLESSVAG